MGEKKLTIQASGQRTPSDYLDYRAFLADLYAAAKASDPSYTYERFGGEIGLSQSNVVNHIIKGRRPLTREAAGRVCSKVGIQGVQRRYFLTLVSYINESDDAARDELFHKLFEIKRQTLGDTLLAEKLTYFSKWYYPVIGELARCKDFSTDPRWIARHLWSDATPKDITRALEFLHDVRILAKDPKTNESRRTELDFSIGHATRDIALSSYHRQMLRISEKALARIKKRDRNFSAMTLVLKDQTQIQALQNLVLEFQRKVMELDLKGSDDRGDAVYQVNLQVFPFIKE